MRKAEKAQDWQTVASRDLDFHTALVSAAKSPRLERMFTTVISETRLCLGLLTGAYDARDDLVEEHREIADLIRDNDTEAAVAVLKKHFDDAVVTLKRRREAESRRREDRLTGRRGSGSCPRTGWPSPGTGSGPTP